MKGSLRSRALGFAATVHAGGWVDFTDETSTRLIGSVGATDTEEKDYAWGDLDQDGDTDLVVVRKEPFTSAGRRANVLFMNEGLADGQAVDGVLVDRTTQWATAADDGGLGFLDDTNDRDVVMVDVNGDTWLDIVTATTISDGLSKTISHPRIYINLGEDAGIWQGLRYEELRTPQIVTVGGDDVAPRFCSIAAGDVTGDGAVELYFGDYDSSGGGGVPMPAGADVNDRLWINNGSGFFTDSMETRMTTEMLLSAFGTSVAIEDMNGDGVNDVVKDTGLSSPTRISVSYNNPANEGVFNGFDVAYANAPYFVTVGDLNNDGLLDMVAVDDGTDRYLLNQGNGVDGQADFLELTFPAASGGFGGNTAIADLNNDGFKDVLITDVDVDIAGCSRRMHIYRNLGNVPDVSFQEQGEVIPNGMLNGTHDVAVFDIDGDGWLDMVIGRCSGTEVWMNVPPTGLIFQFPAGIPAFVTPDITMTFQVQVVAIGGGQHEPGTGKIFISINGAAYTQASMTPLGGDLYEAVLPAVSCTDRVRFYLSGELTTGGVFTDPPGAPTDAFAALAAVGTEISLRDDIEDDVSGWQVTNTLLTSGAWEQADPNGTISGGGMLAAPEDDATNGAENVKAFVTENGAAGGGASATDVDGGPTILTSPVIDLDGSDATISYARWFFCDDEGLSGEDMLTVEISNDGGASWIPVPEHTTTGTGSAWETVSFVVGAYVTPTATIQVRFVTADQPNNSLTEAGIDNFQVEDVLCGEPILDVDEDGIADEIDNCPLFNPEQLDCNGNGVGDVCDVDVSDPDGDGESSGDCNANAVPDECEDPIDDSVAPVVTCPLSLTVGCLDSLDPLVNLTLGGAAAVDDCDPAPAVSYTDVSNPGSCPHETIVTRTWSASDSSGNTGTCDQIITVADQAAPTLTPPADVTASFADAGTCAALLVITPPVAVDICDPAPVVSYQRSDVANPNEGLNDPYPATGFGGPVEITWTATDACGNQTVHVQMVTVDPFNEVVVGVALQPVVSANLSRCLTFEFYSCPGGPVVVEQLVAFDANGEAPGTTLSVPCGGYQCVTVRDPLHTLRRTLGAADGFGVSGTQFTADFIEAAKPLIGGNLNDDIAIDILDFGAFASSFGSPLPPSDCSTVGPHADIGGNGVVDTTDFTFILINFVLVREDNCCGLPGIADAGAGEPIDAISVDELEERGLDTLAVADLNDDGWVDTLDMTAFAAGVRPAPTVRYLGPDGGSWFDPDHWSGRVLPDASMNVELPRHVVVDAPGAVARRVTVLEGGRLDVADGTLFADRMVVRSDARLSLAGVTGSVEVTALALAADAGLDWDGGTLAVVGGRLATGGVDTVVEGARAVNILALDAATAFGSIDVGGNGLVTGAGVVVGKLLNAGELRPIGGLDIDGGFAQTPDGILTTRLGRRGHDRLTASGRVTLGGTLRVQLDAGFVPAVGDRFPVVEAGWLQETLTDVVWPPLPSGRGWRLQVDSGRLVVEVVATPGLGESK